MAANYHVVGIGNAIVDVLAQADDAFIAENGLNRGTMTLIDAAQAERLYAKMGPGLEVSGGSAANTMAGIASLGGNGAYIGKVCDDQLGAVFRHDIRAAGVTFESQPVRGPDAPPTARCLILVTPDAQRTMNTFLGACVELGPEDIDPAMIARAQVTYLEGYLWDRPKAKEAFVKAATLAHAAGRRVSLSLSDPFCVERHRDSFRELVANHVDILFANDEEVRSLFQAATLDEAIHALHGDCELVAITRSGDGSVVLDGMTTYEVPADPVERVVDTTGAGDLYAAGFLWGFTQGRHPAECGRIGSIAAAEVVGHYGARPERSLADLVAETLGRSEGY
ncbi:MAG: adenosine kinase [Rhodospirillaceae bacterium]|nr:adenosine kinase [Rhodospirillaceae bacterium]